MNLCISYPLISLSPCLFHLCLSIFSISVYCCALCYVRPLALTHSHTDAHKHTWTQARKAIGSCWELPVYLINSTWLEAEDMQTRKNKVNNSLPSDARDSVTGKQGRGGRTLKYLVLKKMIQVHMPLFTNYLCGIRPQKMTVCISDCLL